MSTLKDIWADSLRQSLARSGMNGGQVSAILAQYTVLCSRTDKQTAFSQLLESYGSEDTQAAVTSIQSELERMNTKAIDTNPVSRLRRAIERLNSNLDKCGVTVDGRDIDGKQSKVKVPECLKPKTYEALAHYGGRVAKLELVVIL
jgi:hypothetical protein